MMLARVTGTTFGDLVGKLAVPRVECAKCGRFGRYPTRGWIAKLG